MRKLFWLPGPNVCICMGSCQDLEKQLEQTENQLSENADRIGIMDEHLSNVQQELKYTQSRVRGHPSVNKHMLVFGCPRRFQA